MNTAHFELDLFERRRLRQWHRLARPLDPLPPESEPDADIDAPGRFAPGYATDHPLLRAALPVALAILLFLLNDPPRSDASTPRGPAPSESVSP
jgi:hypothetical protein